MRWFDIGRVGRSLALMMSGEAVQSAFHFALNLALLRLLNTRDFGVFSIIMVIGGVSLTYIRALTGMPATVWIGRSRTRAAAAVYDITFGSGAVLLSVGVAIGTAALLHLWLTEGANAGGGFVGLWSLRSYMRWANFAKGRRSAVVASDFAFVSGGVLLASSLFLVPRADALGTAFLVLCAANVIGIAVMLLLVRQRPRVSYGRRIRRRYASFWRQLGWSGLSVTATNLQGQLVALLVTAFCGPAAYAPIAAIILLFVPLRIGSAAIVNLLQPELAAEVAHGEPRKAWMRVKFWSLTSGVAGLAYGAVIFAVLPHLHIRVLDGIPVFPISALAWAVYALMLLYLMPRILLEVMTAFGAIALVSAVAALVGILAVLGLLLVAPPVWSLAGGVLSEGIVLVGLWILLGRELRLAVAAGGAGFSNGAPTPVSRVPAAVAATKGPVA